MKRKYKMAVLGLLVLIAAAVFLFAPVVYILSLHSGASFVRASYPVYVSLGCKTIGFGTIYSPQYGIALACSVRNAPWILSA